MEIIYLNSDYVAVSKPPNYHIDGDYVDTVEKHVEKIGGIRPKLIHQLDYATSGVMLLGLNRKAAGRAAKEFQLRTTKKFYLAVVKGKCEQSYVDKPIDDDADDPKMFKMKASDNGKQAITSIKLLEYDQQKNQSLILLKPLTGRRHQLRVHLLYIDCPIVNDMTYNTDVDWTIEHRLCLHAFYLYNQAVKLELIARDCDFLLQFSVNIDQLVKMCQNWVDVSDQ